MKANLRSPCGHDAPVSASWQAHRNRTPPSPEPGTDYAVPAGTDVHAAGPGTITSTQTSNAGATGRWVRLLLDDGRVVRYLHLSRVNVAPGTRVGRGDVVGVSGASGFGNDWHYGAHVHVTLWKRDGLPMNQTIDFEKYIGPEEDDMPLSDSDLKKIGKAVWGFSMHGGEPYADVPQETAGERLRNIRRSTYGLRARTTKIADTVDDLDTATLTDEQVQQIADQLMVELGEEVAVEVGKRLVNG